MNIEKMNQRIFWFSMLAGVLSTLTWIVRGTEYEYIFWGRSTCELLFWLSGLCLGTAFGTLIIQHKLNSLNALTKQDGD